MRRVSGQSLDSGFRKKAGHPEKNRATGTCRHSSSGLRMTMLSIMPMGAGSSAVSARPTLPTTDSTSGTWAIARSCVLFTSMACESEPCGSSEGM